MRILVLAPQPFFRQRGTPIAVRMLVETLAEAGHRVDLLTFHEGESVPLGGARLHRISPVPFVHDIGPGFSLKKVVCDVALAVRAAQMLRQAEYDVIHAVEEAAFIAQGLGRATSTPYLFDMDSSMPQQLASDVPGAQWARPVLEAVGAQALRDSAGAVVVWGPVGEARRICVASVREDVDIGVVGVDAGIEYSHPNAVVAVFELLPRRWDIDQREGVREPSVAGCRGRGCHFGVRPRGRCRRRLCRQWDYRRRRRGCIRCRPTGSHPVVPVELFDVVDAREPRQRNPVGVDGEDDRASKPEPAVDGDVWVAVGEAFEWCPCGGCMGLNRIDCLLARAVHT